MIRAILLITLGLMFAAFTTPAQTRQQAFEMNERLGRGINMGNSFEAPTETAWGNPWRPSYFKMISNLGFSHVRVPIRWETTERSMTSSPYTISTAFLDRIREVVDSALRYKLHIIINMHHHDTLFKDPAGQRERFLSQWYQIADHFRNYPDSLLFEVLNEPHGNLTPLMWNDYFADALAEIRKTNPTRMVLIGVADYGGLGGISKLELPEDDNIILTVHYYNPFPFTHQGAEWVNGSSAWLGTEWRDTQADRESVASEFSYALQFSETNGIPIHVGEFGAYSKADMDSRKRWTTFLARWFEARNLSWAYWEFSAGFGIYDPATQQYATELTDALLHNEIPEPTPVFATPVYTSNFSGGVDGWWLNQQGGASGSLSASGGKLTVAIASVGTAEWHLQLVKNNIPLEEGKLYRLTFTAQAQSARSITFYAGKASSPWNAYSGYNGVGIGTQEATYTFTFTMTSTTDPAARLVFDLGTNTAAISISGVKVEELTFSSTSVHQEATKQKPFVYPNPASAYCWVEGAGRYDTADLFDLTGKCRATFKITGNTTRIDVAQIPGGMYILSLGGNGDSVKIKVIKQ